MDFGDAAAVAQPLDGRVEHLVASQVEFPAPVFLLQVALQLLQAGAFRVLHFEGVLHIRQQREVRGLQHCWLGGFGLWFLPDGASRWASCRLPASPLRVIPSPWRPPFHVAFF